MLVNSFKPCVQLKNSNQQNQQKLGFSGRWHMPGLVDHLDAPPLTTLQHDKSLLSKFATALTEKAGLSLKPIIKEGKENAIEVVHQDHGTILRVSNQGGNGFEFEHTGMQPVATAATWFDSPSAGNTEPWILRAMSEEWQAAAKKFNFRGELPLPFLPKTRG